MSDTISYPPAEFLADYDAFENFQLGQHGFEKAKVVFSMRYQDRVRFAYRFNRFWCVIVAIESKFPALVHDRIASLDEKRSGGDWLPENLLLALHEWYCSRTDAQMPKMPDPDWPQVMEIYDRLSKAV